MGPYSADQNIIQKQINKQVIALKQAINPLQIISRFRKFVHFSGYKGKI